MSLPCMRAAVDLSWQRIPSAIAGFRGKGLYWESIGVILRLRWGYIGDPLE